MINARVNFDRDPSTDRLFLFAITIAAGHRQVTIDHSPTRRQKSDSGLSRARHLGFRLARKLRTARPIFIDVARKRSWHHRIRLPPLPPPRIAEFSFDEEDEGQEGTTGVARGSSPPSSRSRRGRRSVPSPLALANRRIELEEEEEEGGRAELERMSKNYDARRTPVRRRCLSEPREMTNLLSLVSKGRRSRDTERSFQAVEFPFLARGWNSATWKSIAVARPRSIVTREHSNHVAVATPLAATRRRHVSRIEGTFLSSVRDGAVFIY